MTVIAIGLISVLVFLALLWKADGRSCSHDQSVCTSFEGLGFPYHRGFQGGSSELTLVAAGMRKKKLFVVEVDVYSVGIYLSEAKLDGFKADKKFSSSIPGSAALSAGIVLHFVRDVPTSKVVDAIVEALLHEDSGSEDYKAAVHSLQDYLVASIGEGGMKKDDEIEFSFDGATSSSLTIAVRNQLMGKIENAQLRARLGEIYTGEKAVAPAVHKILSQL